MCNSVAFGLPLYISAKIGCTNFDFLVDTGATTSIVPNHPDFKFMLKPTVVALSNVSGSGITTYGEMDVNLAIPSVRRSFAWTFVVADVVRPILGVDFLAANCRLC